MIHLDQAIILATNGRSGQLDQFGDPAILYHFRVLLRMPTEECRITALLSGIPLPPDTDLSDPVKEAIEILAWRPGEPYHQMINRISQNEIARAVKIGRLMEEITDYGRPILVTGDNIDLMERAQTALSCLIARQPMQNGLIQIGAIK